MEKIFSKPFQVIRTTRKHSWGPMDVNRQLYFIRTVSQLHSYVLQSASKTKAAGYVLNARYNWQDLKQHNGILPTKQEGCA